MAQLLIQAGAKVNFRLPESTARNFLCGVCHHSTIKPEAEWQVITAHAHRHTHSDTCTHARTHAHARTRTHTQGLTEVKCLECQVSICQPRRRRLRRHRARGPPHSCLWFGALAGHESSPGPCAHRSCRERTRIPPRCSRKVSCALCVPDGMACNLISMRNRTARGASALHVAVRRPQNKEMLLLLIRSHASGDSTSSTVLQFSSLCLTP
jgi:hypothetical protein